MAKLRPKAYFWSRAMSVGEIERTVYSHLVTLLAGSLRDIVIQPPLKLYSDISIALGRTLEFGCARVIGEMSNMGRRAVTRNLTGSSLVKLIILSSWTFGATRVRGVCNGASDMVSSVCHLDRLTGYFRLQTWGSFRKS